MISLSLSLSFCESFPYCLGLAPAHPLHPCSLVAQCTPIDLQRDIILSLPEVIDDRAKDVVIEAFVLMLETDQELTVPLIDGLTNLDLPADTTADVRNTVLDKLDSC